MALLLAACLEYDQELPKWRIFRHPVDGQTMKAGRVHAFGPPSAISFEDIPIPAPGAGEILVRVAAAGVGPWDGWIRAGKSALPQPLPLTLGSDLSGIVETVGPGVTSFQNGDVVFGVTNSQFTGAYAEFAIAQAGMIATKPSAIDNLAAASLPVIAVTAWQALFDEAKLQAGQRVLIHGAAGNVGSLAVQFGRQAGLHVIVTASAGDEDYLRTLGAEQIVDYQADRFEDKVGQVDAVIDLVGGETQARSFAVLKPGGALISAVSQPDQEQAKRLGVRAAFFLVKVTTERLNAIAELVQAGRLVAKVGTILPLASVQLAHEMLDGLREHARGKIVLTIREDR